MMTSPADKATDDVRGLVERLKPRWAFDEEISRAAARLDNAMRALVTDYIVKSNALKSEAAATLTSLLERAERAERRAEELADGLMYVTVDHTGCIYTTADEDRAIKLAKDNLAAAIRGERAVRERAEARIKELEQALEPFAMAFEARRNLYSRRYQNRELGFANFDKMPDDWPMEKITFTMGDFRRARAVKGGEG